MNIQKILKTVVIPAGYTAEIRYAKEWRGSEDSLSSIMHPNKKTAQGWVSEDPRYRRVVPVVVIWKRRQARTHRGDAGRGA